MIDLPALAKAVAGVVATEPLDPDGICVYCECSLIVGNRHASSCPWANLLDIVDPPEPDPLPVVTYQAPTGQL